MGRAETAAFLFTDIEGSTRRWQDQPEAMRTALAHHDGLLADAVAAHGGRVFKHTGDGMCAAFPDAVEAVAAAVDAQRALARTEWPDLAEGLAVRMGIHAGAAERRGGDFFGSVLNRTARIMGVAHGGQIVMSAVTAALVADALPEGLALVDLGEHRLRDLANTERIHQVAAEGLPADFPPLRSLDAYHHNLPAQRTTFVGRADEVATVVERLGRAPLVTLTGIGGSGKTRLALEAAVQVLHRHPDGVAFVDLSALGDGELVVSAVATAADLQLGGAARAARDTRAELVSFLRRRTILLVLDNCEHLVDACADLADELLAACSGLTILATSREPLGIEGEHAVRVGSLPTEGPDDDAAHLFHERAAAASSAYDPADHRQAAADIARRLDGIPLAIELAAAQVSHLTPSEILDRLDDRFDLLTGGRRRVQRQQTLEATLDWSHDLLSEGERTLLRRLAVFAGGFSVGDAEAVVADEALPAAAVLRLLGSLVDKSMVTVGEAGEGTRYRLLETVRLYALRRLHEAGDAESTRDRHRDHFLAMAEAVPLDRLYDDLVANDLLWTNIENLRAALDWSRGQRRLDLVARLVAACSGVYWINGLADEALEWSDVALQDDDLDADVRAVVMLVKAIALMMQGDLIAMASHFGEADQTAIGTTTRLVTRGWLGFSLMHRYEEAMAVLESMRDEAEAIGNDNILSQAHFYMASVHAFHGRWSDAVEAYTRAIPTREADQSFAAYFVGAWLAVALAHDGRPDEGLRRLEAVGPSPRTWWEYGWNWCRGIALVEAGRRAEAISELLVATELMQRRGVPLAHRDGLLLCAALALQAGDADRAALITGAIRGRDTGGLALRSPVSYGLFGVCVARSRGALPEGVGRARYEEGKGLDGDELLRAEVDRLAAELEAAGSDPEAGGGGSGDVGAP